jgi:hypothetical protein
MPILQVPTLGPGIGISTSADDYAPVKEMRLFKFDGNNRVPFGALLSAASNDNSYSATLRCDVVNIAKSSRRPTH